MQKPKFKNKYENYIEHEGTYNVMINEGDRADQTRAEELDLKNIIAKYGIIPNELIANASEQLYLNNIGEDLPLAEKMKLREQVDKYFETLPANVRKEFNDDKYEFYEKIISGEHAKMIERGIFDEEQSKQYKQAINQKSNTISELTKQINTLKETLNELQNQTNINSTSANSTNNIQNTQTTLGND